MWLNITFAQWIGSCFLQIMQVCMWRRQHCWSRSYCLMVHRGWTVCLLVAFENQGIVVCGYVILGTREVCRGRSPKRIALVVLSGMSGHKCSLLFLLLVESHLRKFRIILFSFSCGWLVYWCIFDQVSLKNVGMRMLLSAYAGVQLWLLLSKECKWVRFKRKRYLFK